MSEHTPTAVVAAKHSGMAMSGSKTYKRYRLHVRVWGLVLGCLIIIAVIAVGAAWLIKVGQHHSVEQASSSQVTAVKKPSVPQQALGLELNGQGTAAQQLLDTQIAQTHNVVQEGKLYEQKAELACSDNQFTQCVQSAQKAESLNPTVNSASLIATASQALGNKSLALQYYKIELGRLGPLAHTPDAQEVESNIKVLGG